MILRNKKTGEIGNLVLNINPNRERYSVLSTENGDTVCGNLVLADYNSLAELNEEWEDYEDELFYIVSAEHKSGYICALKEDYKELCDVAKKLGIGFETEEEAKKAVEKLKAWKRLKDKGFRFDSWKRDERYYGDFTITATDEISCDDKDLDICFGGEEWQKN